MSADAAAASAVDRTVLDDLLVQLGGETAMQRDLVDSYLTESAEQVAAMLAGILGGDVQTVAGVAHSLRSSSALLGAVALAALLVDVETAARTAPAGLAGLGPRLEAEYARVAADLAQLWPTG